MKTILVPYDFSKEAQYALDFAIGMAKKTQNKLELFHVIELPVPQTFSSFGEAGAFSSETSQIFMIELVEKRKKQMAEFEAEYKDQGFVFQTKMVFGNPFAGISKEIADTRADIVVMGSKGSSGLEEVLIGSNTEKVVRHATCPVLTIKGPVKAGDIKKVVFASDFTDVPGEVIERLKAAIDAIGAELHLVKVITPSMFETSRASIKKIKDFIEDFEIDAASYQVYNSTSEEDGILKYADDMGGDLIAMATHGRTGFLHLLSGSIAEDVVNAAHKPVWTMKIKK